jgi:hypothetical protein
MVTVIPDLPQASLAPQGHPLGPGWPLARQGAEAPRAPRGPRTLGRCLLRSPGGDRKVTKNWGNSWNMVTTAQEFDKFIQKLGELDGHGN